MQNTKVYGKPKIIAITNLNLPFKKADSQKTL